MDDDKGMVKEFEAVRSCLDIILKYFQFVGQCIIARLQRRIENPAKHLRLIFLQKYLPAFSHDLILRKPLFKMFDRIQNTPLEYSHIIYARINLWQ